MAINPLTNYQQVLSMALEDRSRGYQDLVSNNNETLAVLKRKGLWQTYSGPRIRQTIQIDKQAAQWYSGYDFLANPQPDHDAARPRSELCRPAADVYRTLCCIRRGHGRYSEDHQRKRPREAWLSDAAIHWCRPNLGNRHGWRHRVSHAIEYDDRH